LAAIDLGRAWLCGGALVALEPAEAAVLVGPDPDRRHVDVEARQNLRV
jgi:hypothetical protein